jgi:outer membrane receptor protein involved in Fe transport
MPDDTGAAHGAENCARVLVRPGEIPDTDWCTVVQLRSFNNSQGRASGRRFVPGRVAAVGRGARRRNLISGDGKMTRRADTSRQRCTIGGRFRILPHLLGALFTSVVPVSLALAQAAPDAAAPPAAQPAAPGTDAAAGPAANAAAPAAKGTELPEIIITATRHSEALSKVPISVTAYTPEVMEDKGIKSIADIVRYTPGITIDADGTNMVSIRGISSSAGAATTGIYIDDTPIQVRTLGFNTDNAVPNVFDLERVEVLRGPQGTLFGAGAEGGAVRYILAQPNMSKPDFYTRSELSFTQGGAPSYEVGLAGGAPIVDNVLGFRASIWYRRDGGWIDRLNPFTFATVEKDANYSNTVAVRLAAKWAVNDDVTVTPSILYQDKGTNDVSTYFPVLSDPGSDSYKNAWGTPRHEPDRYVLPALKVESEFGKVSFISNTSYYTRRDTSGYDGTMYNLSYYQTFFDNGVTSPGAPYPLIDAAGLHLPASLQNYRAQAPVTNQQQTFAQEFRLQSNDPKADLTWTAGLFYSKTNQTSLEEIIDPMIGPLFQTLFGQSYQSFFLDYNGNPVSLLPNGDSYFNRNQSRDEQLAAFGEGSYAITDKLKATLGLRYSKSDVYFTNFAAGPQNFGFTGGSGEEHEKPLTPKVSLSYQANRDNLYYTTWAKGFRPGGANAPIPQAATCGPDLALLGLSQEPPSYKSDSVKSFEVGAKNKLGDAFRISSSLYYIKWDGIQQNIYLSGCGFQFTENIGAAVAKGGDIQIEFAPGEAWDFDLSVGHTDARISANVYGEAGALIAAKGDAVEGESFGPAAPWTVTLGGQYSFSAFDRKSFVRFDYEYLGHSGVATASEDPRTGAYDPDIYTPKASSFVSVRAGTVIEKWTLNAFIDNLFDSHPQALDSSDYHSAIDAYNPNPPSVLTTAYTYRPRTYGFSVAYHL